MKYTKAQITEAHDTLKHMLKPGETVFTVLRHKSPSGMRRKIGLVLIRPGTGDNKAYALHPNYSAAVMLGLHQGKRDGIIIDGCGMDMGWNLVNNLSRAVFNDEDALNQSWL